MLPFMGWISAYSILIEPCSKFHLSLYQIRKYLHHCLRFAYARTGFAYANHQMHQFFEKNKLYHTYILIDGLENLTSFHIFHTI